MLYHDFIPTRDCKGKLRHLLTKKLIKNTDEDYMNTNAKTEARAVAHGAARAATTTTPANVDYTTQFPQLKEGCCISNFSLKRFEPVSEINGAAYLMQHQPTGARLVWFACPENNKAFSIAFKTPPVNDTGVFHVLEHSVLCGSQKFPVKEPFTHLLKTSMQTFLNAMTFPDKTMYPVASTNEQDLLNLMDVYIDAVLHPAIYHKPYILEQEGWHYELDEKGGEPASTTSIEDSGDAPAAPAQTLSYNGVVFSEMKGVLSDPDSVLLQEVTRQLFPDTAYRFESGGNPLAIPQLSYDEFIDTHARHYRLDNSYTILYGNMHIESILAFLDERFCTQENRDAGRPNTLDIQAPVSVRHATTTMQTTQDNACSALSFAIGSSKDRTRVLAVDILLDALFGSNEAPLKKALLDEKIADDVCAYLMDGIAQPYILLELKGAKPDTLEHFYELVQSLCHHIAHEGIDRNLLEASLAQAEFNLRENEWGSYPDGIALSMQAMNSWLYDDDDPTSYIHYEEALRELHQAFDTDWYERLLEEIICNNTHFACVELVPSAEGDAQKQACHLAALAASMSPEDLSDIKQKTEHLRELQEVPDAPEDVAKLPKLSLADLDEPPAEVAMQLCEQYTARYGVPSYLHDFATNYINYVYYYFDLAHLHFEDMPYVTILSDVLGKLATTHYSAAELDTLIESQLGSLSFFVENTANAHDPNKLQVKLVVAVSSLTDKLSQTSAIPAHIWSSTNFNDRARILQTLTQRRIAMEQGFMGAGHAYAMSRLYSYFSKNALLSQQINGIDYYFFLCDLIEHFDEKFDELRAKLAELCRSIFVKPGVGASAGAPAASSTAPGAASNAASHLELSFTGSKDELESWWQHAAELDFFAGAANASEANTAANATATTNTSDKAGEVANSLAEQQLIIPEPQIKNEAFGVPGNVVFVAKGAILPNAASEAKSADPAGPANSADADDPKDGVWQVINRAISLDYLWKEVRVAGGAYGCGFSTATDGFARFFSYRDPHIDETLQRFENTAGWLANWQPSEDELCGYIVSTVASYDAPEKPRATARAQDLLRLSGQDPDIRLRHRAEALATTVEQIHARAQKLAQLHNKHAICVFGSKDIIEASNAELTRIPLMRDANDTTNDEAVPDDATAAEKIDEAATRPTNA